MGQDTHDVGYTRSGIYTGQYIGALEFVQYFPFSFKIDYLLFVMYNDVLSSNSIIPRTRDSECRRYLLIPPKHWIEVHKFPGFFSLSLFQNLLIPIFKLANNCISIVEQIFSKSPAIFSWLLIDVIGVTKNLFDRPEFQTVNLNFFQRILFQRVKNERSRNRGM